MNSREELVLMLEFKKNLTYISSYFIGLIIGLFILNYVAPYPTPGHIESKMANYQSQRNNVDVVFVGSSRVFRSMNPQEFDKALQEKDIALRSYNLGIAGLRIDSLNALLNRYLRGHHKPKYLVIEVFSDKTNLPENEKISTWS